MMTRADNAMMARLFVVATAVAVTSGFSIAVSSPGQAMRCRMQQRSAVPTSFLTWRSRDQMVDKDGTETPGTEADIWLARVARAEHLASEKRKETKKTVTWQSRDQMVEEEGTEAPVKEVDIWLARVARAERLASEKRKVRQNAVVQLCHPSFPSDGISESIPSLTGTPGPPATPKRQERRLSKLVLSFFRLGAAH